MGNGTSSSVLSGNRIAKVIDAQGKLRKVELPVKAAEIMLEEPGHIISAVEELKRGRRVVAMRADDELSVGKVYALVPVGRVHCRVTDADMGVIKAACCSGKKKKSGGKVLPDVMVAEGIPPVSGYRIGSCRPWIPVLESIPEVL
ncbi:hypothetical protein HRI_000332300 [Hibiscus trionum]|uniref:Uncharacterized protein n=1 Tax=Hibiscus trionum TaxID=183268 RepID=A0A9W7GW10_HIBTR|nr:hypothetical protein HRI_000332300 [Hibiscus trionum]